MISADVSYINADAEIVTDYNSKNKLLTEAVTTSDAFSSTTVYSRVFTDSITIVDTPDIGQIHHVNPTDSVTVSDLMITYHDGMLNTNMLNTRLISAGDLEVLVSDVSVTLS